MTDEELRQAIAKGFTNDEFARVAASLRSRRGDEVFGSALASRAKNGDLQTAHWAGCLLIQLEPWRPVSVENAIREVAASSLNPSHREVPFYLAAQFGKRAVGERRYR